MSASSHTRTGCNEITTTSGSWIPESYGIYNKSFIEATSVTSDDANHKGWAGADKGDEAVYLKDPQYFDVDNDPTTTGTKKKEPLRKGKWTVSMSTMKHVHYDHFVTLLFCNYKYCKAICNLMR
jgi:hypothetical protein